MPCDTVNNYKFGVYDDNEVWIQTTPRQLESAAGRVFLTVMELRRLLAVAKSHWHESNPWRDDIIYVPIEKLAEALAGGTIEVENGRIAPHDAAFILEHWHHTARIRGTDGKLDAYILPQPSGDHSCGVRYGCNDSDYFSPYNRNPDKVIALLNEYR